MTATPGLQVLYRPPMHWERFRLTHPGQSHCLRGILAPLISRQKKTAPPYQSSSSDAGSSWSTCRSHHTKKFPIKTQQELVAQSNHHHHPRYPTLHPPPCPRAVSVCECLPLTPLPTSACSLPAALTTIHQPLPWLPPPPFHLSRESC